MRNFARSLAASVVVVVVLSAVMPAAVAFKPYTHARTGDRVLDDVADGSVTIAGRSYPVSQPVVDALLDHPEFYNAGVIGPDGFPDLTYGQSVIHPEDTGLWLRHIFDAAWAAQGDASYTATQRSQILAFAYGFLMHAAGDVWAHTLVNDFSEGTFPGVGDILTDADMAAIALRHIIVEGYIGDATAGYDGNTERGPAPGGDVSDDATLGIEFPDAAEFAGVRRFLFDTLIDPTAATPSNDRGPLIGFFLGLRDDLRAAAGPSVDPLETVLSSWQSAVNRYDALEDEAAELEALVDAWNNCAIDDFSCSRIVIMGQITAKLVELGLSAAVATGQAALDLFEGALTAAGEAVAAAAEALLDAYLAAWADDIDAGLAEWAELGRASTVALFDAQARRDLQNDECALEGDETDLNRANCEDAISTTDVLFDQADPFINSHLLSMLGAPDFVGGLRQALQDFSSEIDAILGPLGVPFNPLEEGLAQITEFAKQLVLDFVEAAFGIDVETLRNLLTEPTSWLNVDDITVDLPVLGRFEIINLFDVTDTDGDPSDHDRLDGYLGFTGHDHHEPADPPWGGFPVAGSKLADDVEFGDGDLAIFDNAVTLGKLLLLDGATLDQLLSDLVGQPYTFYGTAPGRSNIMLTPFPGVPGASTQQWLASIDADHAWRADGRPVFTAASGGEGNFPLWESCILRDSAFRGLFTDWENGAANFPDLGDAPTVDPNDPLPPTSAVAVSGTSYTNGAGTTFVGDEATLTVNASDVFWPDADLSVTATITDANGAVTAQEVGDGDTLNLSGLPDGPTSISLQASDPCGTEAAHATNVVIDTTAPQVTISSPRPDGAVFATDVFSSIDWTSDDGTHGSGVASDSASFGGTSGLAAGYVLDMYLLDPGEHTFTVTAADNLGNTGTSGGTFVVRATAASLGNNLQRAFDEGDIPNLGTFRALASTIAAAGAAHDRGDHATEHNILGAFVAQLEALRGTKVDSVVGDRLIDYARDLITNGG